MGTAGPRPLYHFAPARGWLNDPCGLVHHDGLWHLCFQHNPGESRWGDIHWGHAVSPDLVRWRELAPVLAPDPELGLAFTGSACQAPGRAGRDVVALLTHAGGRDGAQKQSLARSSDGYRTLRVAPESPVIPNPGLPDFRDPRLLWHADEGAWLAVVAAGDRALLYASTDLLRWERRGAIGPFDALPAGGVWECPELVQVPDERGGARWLLKVDANLGHHAPGASRTWLGRLDPRAGFDPEGPARPLDLGPDFYAAQCFSDAPDGSVVWIGWLDSWAYAAHGPDPGWRGVLSLPRTLSLQAGEDGAPRLVQRPAPALRSALAWRLLHESARPYTLRDRSAQVARGRQLHVELELEPRGAANAGLELCAGPLGQVRLLYTRDGQLTLTRAGEHLPAAMQHPCGGPVPLRGGCLQLEAWLDSHSLEVFAQGGRHVLSARLVPARGHEALRLLARDGAVVVHHLSVHRLERERAVAP